MKDPVREQVIKLLDGGQAHVTFDEVIKDFPENLRGAKTKGLPYTAWQLLEHMRIAQSDILEFSRNAEHVSPAWPEGYWPKSDAPASAAEWDNSVQAVKNDLAAMRDLVADSATDLYATIPHGTGQNILREALLVADHNAYHTGQLLLVRRILGAWQA